VHLCAQSQGTCGNEPHSIELTGILPVARDLVRYAHVSIPVVGAQSFETEACPIAADFGKLNRVTIGVPELKRGGPFHDLGSNLNGRQL
jgi:hypothetical protein